MLPLVALSLAASLGPPKIEWDAPPTCPPASHVDRRIAELLGDPPPQLPAATSVRGRVRRVQGRWRLELDLSGPRGSEHRTIEADDCRDLADAAALVAAAAFDTPREGEPLATELEPPAPPEPESAPVPEPDPESVPRVEPEPVPPSAPSSTPEPVSSAAARVTLHALLRAGAGRVAGGDASFVAGAGALWNRARIDLFASAFVPGVALHPRRAMEAKMTLWTLGLRGGPRWTWERFGLSVLGALEGGPVRMRGRGAGVDRVRDATTAWLGLGPQIALTFRATRIVSLVIQGEVFGAVLRPQAEVQGEPPFWSARWVAGGGAVGLQLGGFPRAARQFRRKRRR